MVIFTTAIIFALNGCVGAMGSSLMLRPQKNYDSRNEVIDSSKRLVFDLYIEEVSRYLPKKIKNSDWRIVGLAANLLIPLPPARIKDFVAFGIKNPAPNDIEKVAKIFEKNDWKLSGISKKQDGKLLFVKGLNDEAYLTKNSVVITSFDAFRILQEIRKELQIEFSPESEKVYQEARKS